MSENDVIGIGMTLLAVYVISRIGTWIATGIGMVIFTFLMLLGVWCGFWVLYLLGMAVLGYW